MNIIVSYRQIPYLCFLMKIVLVIDDDQRIRENTAELLILSGYEVITASNGKIGFDKALKFQPDVIMCDIMMPETNGVGFLNLIYKEPSIKDTPLIFMSGAVMPEYVHRSLIKAGYEFLSKPFTEKQLLDALERSSNKSPVSV